MGVPSHSGSAGVTVVACVDIVVDVLECEVEGDLLDRMESAAKSKREVNTPSYPRGDWYASLFGDSSTTEHSAMAEWYQQNLLDRFPSRNFLQASRLLV